MIFDSNGIPKDSGATDYMDSARLIGVLAAFKIQPPVSAQAMAQFSSNGIVVRYPFVDPSNAASNNPLNVTRDQMLCLTAGFYYKNWFNKCYEIVRAREKNRTLGLIWRAQNTEADVVGSTKPWYNGADLLTPSHVNHLRLCACQRGTLLGYLWLRADILFYTTFNRRDEPLQLLCMCLVAGPSYVKLLMRLMGEDLNTSIRLYFSGWRSEGDVAEQMISHLKLNYSTNK